MKPFNLEEAKAGKPVCTRDGRDVRILCFDLKSTSRPIVAAVQHEADKEDEYVTTYSVLGHHFSDRVNEGDDLMMKSEKICGWIGICRKCDDCYDGDPEEVSWTTHLYSTREKAEKAIKTLCRTSKFEVKQIEWEE